FEPGAARGPVWRARCAEGGIEQHHLHVKEKEGPGTLADGSEMVAIGRGPLRRRRRGFEEPADPELGAAPVYSASQRSNQRSSASSTRPRSLAGSFSSSW